MDNKNIVIGVLIISALIVLNLLLVFGVFDNETCIQVEDHEGNPYNVYLCGEHNPLSEVKQIMNDPEHVYVVFESDSEKTQKGSHIAEGVVSLAELLETEHDVSYYGISFENGVPVQCDSKMNISLDECLNLKPGNNSALIYLEYPEFPRSEIVAEGNTIYFRPQTSLYLKNMVNVVFSYIIRS